MRFAKRTNWNTEESELARAHRERLAAGEPLADLTASNPTRCGFAYDAELLAALGDRRSLDYDPDPRGLRAAREAVCRYYADHHSVGLTPENVVLTTSTSEAYSFLFRLLCEPGDEVVTLVPGYPLFDFLAALDDVVLKPVALFYDHGWTLDHEALEQAVTERTRAIVLVHPNNPTGHFTKEREREELGRICRAKNVALIVDEVFLDYGLGEAEARSFAGGLQGAPVFVVSGLSKIAGLPQMKSAWIAAAGEGMGEAMARLEVIADTFLSMNAPVQWAMPKWLEARRGIQGQMMGRVRANLAELDRQLGEQKAVQRLVVEGGWYAVLRVPKLDPDERTVMNLLDRGAWVHPGYFFGMEEMGWLVVSLLGREEEFKQGLKIVLGYFAGEPRK